MQKSGVGAKRPGKQSEQAYVCGSALVQDGRIWLTYRSMPGNFVRQFRSRLVHHELISSWKDAESLCHLRVHQGSSSTSEP